MSRPTAGEKKECGGPSVSSISLLLLAERLMWNVRGVRERELPLGFGLCLGRPGQCASTRCYPNNENSIQN